MLLKIREESSLSVHKWRFIRPGWLKNSPSACSSLSKDRGCLEQRYFLMLVSHVGAEATVMVCLGQTCRRPGCAPRAQWEPERMQAAGIHLPQQNNFSSVQFSSVAQSCPTLCIPMNCSMPGLPVHHQCPEFTQTHVHWVGDAIQPSYPLLSPSPPATNPSQHQGLFQWIKSLHEVAKVLKFQPQHQSFQWTPRIDLL